jgi:hypothetical protein
VPKLTWPYQTAETRDFLALFGPLLAHQIDVYHPATRRTGQLRGLPFTHNGERVFAQVEWYLDEEAQAECAANDDEAPGKLLPVLYAFEDLATEITLADGRRVVPAVEALRIALGDMHELDDSQADVHKIVCRVQPHTIAPYARIESYPSNEGGWIHRTAEYDWHFDGFNDMKPMWAWKAYLWLLSVGFAVGLRPDQYHRKQVAQPTVKLCDCETDPPCHCGDGEASHGLGRIEHDFVAMPMPCTGDCENCTGGKTAVKLHTETDLNTLPF